MSAPTREGSPKKAAGDPPEIHSVIFIIRIAPGAGKMLRQQRKSCRPWANLVQVSNMKRDSERCVTSLHAVLPVTQSLLSQRLQLSFISANYIQLMFSVPVPTSSLMVLCSH